VPSVTRNVPLVDLEAQQAALAPELEDAVVEQLHRTDWILGQAVTDFEADFAAFCETAHAVGTDSGLSALELALRAAGIGAGDEVITQANTFVATALAISHAGARPVLVDVDPVTHMLDPDRLDSAITGRTKAVVPVHLYGHPAPMDEILGIAAEHDLTVVEDACQAHGARYKGRRVGTFGHGAAFSFYPGKNLGALGDAGALVTNDDELAAAVRVLRDYGAREKYLHVVKGFNRRLDTLQAVALRVKLRHLEDWNRARRAWAEAYSQALRDAAVRLPVTADEVEHVWHLYVIGTPRRDELREHLSGLGIGTGVHYPTPIHLQPAYAELGHSRGDFPVSEALALESLSLPMFPELDAATIERIATAIAEFAGG
jgi:dTDP-3-amino-3,4,6-trideoxy-alpha-D-glucose transaminase